MRRPKKPWPAADRSRPAARGRKAVTHIRFVDPEAVQGFTEAHAQEGIGEQIFVGDLPDLLDQLLNHVHDDVALDE